MTEPEAKPEAKTVVNLAPTSRAKRKDAKVKLVDCTFANAVKVGQHQLLYIHSKQYDITLKDHLVSIRLKTWKADMDTVYTTTYNMIYWR
jgi:hypothetical protein